MKSCHYTLEETIEKDCKEWERLKNDNSMIQHYMYLNECSNSKDSGMYQLILNGTELWFGTLKEINAVVKSMICLLDKPEFYEP